MHISQRRKMRPSTYKAISNGTVLDLEVIILHAGRFQIGTTVLSVFRSYQNYKVPNNNNGFLIINKLDPDDYQDLVITNEQGNRTITLRHDFDQCFLKD